MPHIIIKMYSGRSEEVKQKLTLRVAEEVAEITGCKLSSVSVSIEDYDPDELADSVYKVDVLYNKETLYKKPGYNPFENQD